MEVVCRLAEIVAKVRGQRPLVHQITNYVSVNDCANIVLAYGGAPVMADDLEEVQEMVGIASALVLNIGTLNSRTVAAMLLAGRAANERGIPVVLDPVGVGATTLRTRTAQEIMSQVKLAVIRGNASEIAVLAGEEAVTRGVDAGGVQSGTLLFGSALAVSEQCVVAITGEHDIITDGRTTLVCSNGHPLMAKITGTGCMASALVGAAVGVTDDYLLATAAALVSMGLAGEYAARESGLSNLGSYRTHIIDYVGKFTHTDLQSGAKIHAQR